MAVLTDFYTSGALFNAERTHRYQLWRAWGTGLRLGWLMMNPSTADERLPDPTIRRCLGFAHTWGFEGIEVFNVATFRTPSPDVMVAADRAGVDVFHRTERDAAIRAALPTLGRVIVAWGACPLTCTEAPHVVGLLTGVEVMTLGRTKAGHPKHPLYARGDLQPIPWSAPC